MCDIEQNCGRTKYIIGFPLAGGKNESLKPGYIINMTINFV
jgi:hypothetical protein